MLAGLTLAAHIAMTIGKKVLELHNKGVDRKVIDEINKVVKEVHDVIDGHHTNAGLKNDQETDDVQFSDGQPDEV